MSIAVAYFLLALGVFFGVLGNVGILRFPDVYTRLQASAKCSTTSLLSILIACAFWAGLSQVTFKIVVVTIFFLITGPITTHIIGRHAWKRGVGPFVSKHPRRGQEEQ